MNVPVRLGVYATTLGVVFGGAFGGSRLLHDGSTSPGGAAAVTVVAHPEPMAAVDPTPVPAPSGSPTPTPRVLDVVTADGAVIHLNGMPASTGPTMLWFTLTTATGRTVATLPAEPADLLAYRDSDLAVVPVQSTSGPPGPGVGYGLDFPTPDRYRIILNLRTETGPRRAEFTVDIPQSEQVNP